MAMLAGAGGVAALSDGVAAGGGMGAGGCAADGGKGGGGNGVDAAATAGIGVGATTTLAEGFFSPQALNAITEAIVTSAR